MTALSITEASQAGLSALVTATEEGRNTPLSRHGKVVAEVVSTKEITQLRHDRDTLRDAALAMARSATDSGIRTTLDHAMEIFNLNRAELEAENAREAQCDNS